MRVEGAPLGPFQEEFALRSLSNNYRWVREGPRLQHKWSGLPCSALLLPGSYCHFRPCPCPALCGARRPVIGFPAALEKCLTTRLLTLPPMPCWHQATSDRLSPRSGAHRATGGAGLLQPALWAQLGEWER